MSSLVKFLTLIGLLLELSFCSGCTGGCQPAPIPLSAEVLRVQLTAEPVSLDPALVEDGLSLRVLANVMEGLVGYNGAGELENRLAESIKVSSDGLRYEFKLRPGVTWSDGRAVSVLDFIAGIRRSLKPGTPSKLAPLLFPIKGARQYQSGTSPELPGVLEASGNLVIELEEPTSYFTQVLTLPVAYPIREEVLAVNNGHWPTTAPVTGPYRILRHVNDQKIVLNRNPAYWRPMVPGSIRTVELLVIQDESTGVNLFEQGKVDILTRLPSLDYPRFKKKGVLHTDPFMATYYLSFNTRRPPFNDRQWRRAVAGAIDREGITSVLGTGETPARSWIPRGLEGFQEFEDPAPLFAGALAAVKKSPLKSEISAAFDSGARNSAIMEKIQNDLKSKLGWKLALSTQDWKSYIRSLQSDPASLYRFAWLAPFKDPISHLQAFMGSNPNNYSGWSNAKYDELVQRIQSLAPGPERLRKIIEAQAILVDEEAAVIPIYHYVQNHAVSPRVKGFRVNPFGMIRFDELSLK